MSSLNFASSVNSYNSYCFHELGAVVVLQTHGVSAGDVNAWERVRLAIIRRKDELDLNNREFGRRFARPHGDQWVSNLLNPKTKNKLSLLELDEVARILKTTPAALVKS